MLDGLTVDDFRPAVGQRFVLHLDGAEPLDLELVDAQAYGSAAPAGPDGRQARAPFNLLFRGPVEPILPQQIYRLENETLGALEIFIVPLGPGEGGARYEAIFA